MKNDHLPFHIIIVEDDDLWLDEMKRALQAMTLGSSSDAVSYCKTRSDLENAQKESHFHIASLDQRIPSIYGSIVSLNAGLESYNYVINNYPFTDICIYTAFDTIEIGAAAGENTLILRKNSPCGDGVKPPEWAGALVERLQKKYFNFYFKQGENYLPPHLASVATFISQALDNKDWQNCVAHAINFWSLTLRIGLAQAQALCRHYKLPWETANADNYYSMQGALETMLERLGPERLTPWRPYIGKGGKKGGVGKVLISKGIEPMRLIRNEVAHATNFKPWEERFTEMCPGLFRMMDAAAFWGSFPLASDIRAKDHGYTGKLLQGTGYPWKEVALSAPDGFQSQKGHVYLRWNSTEGTIEWVDLWPFIHLEFDEKLNREVIWVLGNHWNGRWYRCSLQDGKTHPWRPPDDVIAVLLQHQ